MSAANWLAAQYDGTSLRLWSMQGAEVIGEARSANARAEEVMQVLHDLPDLPVILADLTGLLPRDEPRPAPSPATLELVQTTLGARRVWMARGVTQAEPPARLFGQTAVVAGLLAADPQFDGVVCVTGRHTHWVRVSAGEICHFHGYLSGEIFEWIAAETPSDAPDIFLSALGDALSRPHRAYGALLGLRGATGDEAARLAGLLLGCELADAKPYWLGETVAVAGNGLFGDLMAIALGHQGVQVRRPDHDAALLAGLYQAWKSLPE